MMLVRKPVASHFYPGDNKTQIENFTAGYKVPDEPTTIRAGIVPHAGWSFSGGVASKVFKSIHVKNSPTTFILLGFIHGWVPHNAVYAKGAWSTPLGDLEIDERIAGEILTKLGDDVVEDPKAHATEHSLEVQLPFIKYFFPDSKIVPIAINPSDNAHVIGQKIGEIARAHGENIIVVGTTDLTHYGDSYGYIPYGRGKEAKEKMQQKDSRIIELALNMQAPEIVNEARINHNACGPGAMAATVAAAKTMGADKGYLLEYTTSYDVMPEREFPSAVVGYAGIVF